MNNAADLKFLQNSKIDIIINVTKDVGFIYPNQFQYIRIPISDKGDQSLNPHFKILEQNRGIFEGDKNILIHCKAGVS